MIDLRLRLFMQSHSLSVTLNPQEVRTFSLHLLLRLLLYKNAIFVVKRERCSLQAERNRELGATVDKERSRFYHPPDYIRDFRNCANNGGIVNNRYGLVRVSLLLVSYRIVAAVYKHRCGEGA